MTGQRSRVAQRLPGQGSAERAEYGPAGRDGYRTTGPEDYGAGQQDGFGGTGRNGAGGQSRHPEHPRNADGVSGQSRHPEQPRSGSAVSGQPRSPVQPRNGDSHAVAEDAVVRRTPDGWRVGDDEVSDLTSAMVLADLLAADEGMPGDMPPKPDQAPDRTSEASKLRATVEQLEHALTARVRVEQAIGVLAERHRIKPRHAFEQLRSAARNRGRRVSEIAALVVASATNPLLQLPEELSRQPRTATRRGGRHARQAHGAS
jgi:hypothetical protein